MNAIDLLAGEHARIERMFARLADIGGGAKHADDRRRAANEVCMALTILMRIEQELVHPAFREACGDDLVDDMEAGHDGLRDVVAHLLAMVPGDPLHAARLNLLRDYALAHLGHEREMFPRARACGVNMKSLGRAIEVRLDELRCVADALRGEALVASLSA